MQCSVLREGRNLLARPMGRGIGTRRRDVSGRVHGWLGSNTCAHRGASTIVVSVGSHQMVRSLCVWESRALRISNLTSIGRLFVHTSEPATTSANAKGQCVHVRTGSDTGLSLAKSVMPGSYANEDTVDGVVSAHHSSHLPCRYIALEQVSVAAPTLAPSVGVADPVARLLHSLPISAMAVAPCTRSMYSGPDGPLGC